MSVVGWIAVSAIVTAVVAALVGSLLVVGGRSMVGEGLSHAVLPGIVGGYLITGDPSSPWLVLTAAAAGLLMVWVVERLARGGRVDEDAALGIVFSAMFAAGVLMVAWAGRSSALDADCVIDGNLALASLDRADVFGVEVPRSVVLLTLLGCAALLTLAVGYKEYQLSLFDPVLSRRLKRRPDRWQRWWLMLTALVTVAAFQSAGSVVIAALMTAPGATARLVTRNLGALIAVAVVVAVAAAGAGTAWGLAVDVTPSGPIALVSGLIFVGVWALQPVARRWRRSAAV